MALALASTVHWSSLPGPAPQEALTVITEAPRSASSVYSVGESDVVAQRDADADAIDGDHDRFAAGRDGVGLGEAERVVEVDLVVARRRPPAPVASNVLVHPPIICGGEHAGERR